MPVCLMTVTDDAQQIYKGTLLAKMTAADEENTPETSEEKFTLCVKSSEGYLRRR